MIDARTISELDQHKMRMKEVVAPALHGFYEALRKEGFTDEQAMHLVDGYFAETFLTSDCGCAECCGQEEGDDDDEEDEEDE